MTENEQKIKLLDIQLIATFGLMCTIALSFLLAYDKKLSLENKKRLFTEKEAQNVALLKTLGVLLVSLTFLYISYQQYKIAKTKHENDEKELFVELEISVISLIISLVGIYIVFKNYRSNLSISEVESI